MDDAVALEGGFDPSRPNVARVYDYLLLCGIAHYILDADGPADLVGTLVDALPSGSYVFIHHLLDTGDPAATDLQASMLKGLGRVQFRTMAQVRALFGDLELIPPGLVPVPAWRPDPGMPLRADYGPVLELACVGVGKKPDPHAW